MKKNYVKPQLWKEAFQPADAIAGNCTIEVGFNEDACSYGNPGWTVFVVGADLGGPCDLGWDKFKGHDKQCYHSSQNAQGYFAS